MAGRTSEPRFALPARLTPGVANAIAFADGRLQDAPACFVPQSDRCDRTHAQLLVNSVAIASEEKIRTGHNGELLARLTEGKASSVKLNLYASAYRAIERNGQPSLDIWSEELAIGSLLPTLPLWLHGEICLPVDLAATYERTCREQRLRLAVLEFIMITLSTDS